MRIFKKVYAVISYENPQTFYWETRLKMWETNTECICTKAGISASCCDYIAFRDCALFSRSS